MSSTNAAQAWYRNPEPWLLLIAPLAAVVGGLFTLWLAIHSNNSMVVDDYYREGRAINQTLARDARAQQLGLAAEWTIDIGTSRARLTLTAKDGASFAAPERLIVRLIHATEAELDHRLILTRVSTERWEAPFAAPMRARWTLQIEDESREWRLLGALTDPAAPRTISALSPDDNKTTVPTGLK